MGSSQHHQVELNVLELDHDYQNHPSPSVGSPFLDSANSHVLLQGQAARSVVALGMESSFSRPECPSICFCKEYDDHDVVPNESTHHHFLLLQQTSRHNLSSPEKTLGSYNSSHAHPHTEEANYTVLYNLQSSADQLYQILRKMQLYSELHPGSPQEDRHMNSCLMQQPTSSPHHEQLPGDESDQQRRSSNYCALPAAGRYSDAPRGTQNDLKESEHILLPNSTQNWPFLLRFPINSFGITLGLGSQTILWKHAAASPCIKHFLHLTHLPAHHINLIVWCIAVASTLLIFATFILKCIFYFEAVRREYHDPVRVNYFFAPWIACMLLTLGLPTALATNSIHPAVWCIFMTPLVGLCLKIYGQWLSGGARRLSKVANPSTHLAVVGSFVGAMVGARVGWKEAAKLWWAIGMAHYVVLFVTLYERLPNNMTLPKELHPVLFLSVAAPSMASVAWEEISGEFERLSKILYFVALFLLASLVLRLNLFKGLRFSIAWWAYTFPITATSIATIHYANKVTTHITQALATLFTCVSTMIVFILFISTLCHAFIWGTLFPNDLIIAITPRRHKTKYKSPKISSFGPNKTPNDHQSN